MSQGRTQQYEQSQATRDCSEVNQVQIRTANETDDAQAENGVSCCCCVRDALRLPISAKISLRSCQLVSQDSCPQHTSHGKPLGELVQSALRSQHRACCLCCHPCCHPCCLPCLLRHSRHLRRHSRHPLYHRRHTLAGLDPLDPVATVSTPSTHAHLATSRMKIARPLISESLRFSMAHLASDGLSNSTILEHKRAVSVTQRVHASRGVWLLTRSPAHSQVSSPSQSSEGSQVPLSVRLSRLQS